MTEKLGWDYNHSLEKVCIWEREKKLSGSAAELDEGKLLLLNVYTFQQVGFLWGLLVPVSGSLSANSMNGWNAFVMNCGFSEKQVAKESIHAWGFWIIKARKILECLLIHLHLVHLKDHEPGAM